MTYWGQPVTVTERATDGMIADWTALQLNDLKCAVMFWKFKRVTYSRTDILCYKGVLMLQKFIIVVCFLLGNSPASEFYKPAFFLFIRVWRWNRQSVPKGWHVKYRRRRIAQKKTHNIQNAAKVWKQEKFIIAWNIEWRSNCLIERLSNIGWFKCLIIEHGVD
jgi:hypothetical protein